MMRWLLGAAVLGVLLAAALLWWMARDGAPSSRPGVMGAAGTVEGPKDAGRPAPDVMRLAPEPREFGVGHRISLREYRADQAAPGGDWRADLLRVEVCAGTEALRGGALPAAFSLGYRLPDGDVEYRSAASAMTVVEPPLSSRLAGDDLPSGDCREGWVSFVLGEGRAVDTRRPDRLRFDNRAFGFVPASSRGDLEWSLNKKTVSQSP